MGSSDKFMENYRTCCSASKTRLKVKTVAGGKLLDFNADRLDAEDWRPLFTALKWDRNLHTLAIKSEYSGKLWSTSTLKIKPSVYKSDVMNELVESMVSCMKKSSILSTVHLQSLPLNTFHVEMLADGVRSCLSLQNLWLTRFTLTDEGLDALYRVVHPHVGLTTIDFTDCGLTAQGAKVIAKVIRTQRLARYDETWKHSLRYRETNQELQPGLRRIALNDNPLVGDEGFMCIAHELMDDLWVEAVCFQNCALTDVSADEAVKLLKTNETITVLDVSRNAGIKDEIKTQIKRILLERKRGESATDCSVASRTGGVNNRKKPKQPKTALTGGIFKKTSSQCVSNGLTYTKGPAVEQMMSVELQHTKRALGHMKRYLVKEKEKCEELENEKRAQKMKLADKYNKEWKKRKDVEKERDKLKHGLSSLLAEGHMTTAEDFSKANDFLYTWKSNKIKNKTFKNKQNGGGDQIDDTETCDVRHAPIKTEKHTNKILQKTKQKKLDKYYPRTPNNTPVKSKAFQREINYFNDNENFNTETETSNNDKEEVKHQHPRDMSPISRSQWIFKEIRMNKLQKQKQMENDLNSYVCD